MIPFLKLLDDVINAEEKEAPKQKPQERFVEGAKDFTAGIKKAFDKFNPFR